MRYHKSLLFTVRWMGCTTKAVVVGTSRHVCKAANEVSISKTTVTKYILQSISEANAKIAVTNGITGESKSASELHHEILYACQGIRSLGVTKGDTVCLFGTNAPEFIHVVCAVMSAGAALTTANSQLTRDELVTQLKLTKSKILITTEDISQIAIQAKDRCHSVEKILVIGEAEGCLPFASLINKRDRTPELQDHAEPHDVALIPFSSGTTGVPKGVQLTHQNIVSQLNQLRHETVIPLTTEDVSICALPMVHIAGFMISLLNALCQGASVVVLPKFESETFLGSIQKYKGTFSLIAPPVVNFLAKHPMVDQYDISSLHTPYCGAATLSRELTEQMVHRLNIQTIRQGYGMSETTGATHTDPPGEIIYGSIGKPVPNTLVKVVSLDGERELSTNETGELWCKGPQILKGYLNNPEATKGSLTQDGWLKTGDVGYYDKSDHFFIVDRIKDIIKYKGYQVSPAYLESILVQHPSVSDAAVIGIPDGSNGHVPRAYVILHKAVDPNVLIKFTNDKVSNFKRLRGGLSIVDELPKSPSGKLLRKNLVEMYIKENK